MPPMNKVVSYKTPFFVRVKDPSMSFADHETHINVYGNNVVKINSPIGRRTMEWLRKGGLVQCSAEEVAEAQGEGREMEEDAFKPSTKVVMKKTKRGLHPTEVPLEDGDENSEDLGDPAARAEFKQTHTTDENTEDGIAKPDEKHEKVDGAAPGFAKTGARK